VAVNWFSILATQDQAIPLPNSVVHGHWSESARIRLPGLSDLGFFLDLGSELLGNDKPDRNGRQVNQTIQLVSSGMGSTL
jgi:hypothetical protein